MTSDSSRSRRREPDLERLHQELDGLAFEERASFAPELAGELARRGRARGPRRGGWRLASAAVLVGVLGLAGLHSPARATAARLLQAVLPAPEVPPRANGRIGNVGGDEPPAPASSAGQAPTDPSGGLVESASSPPPSVSIGQATAPAGPDETPPFTLAPVTFPKLVDADGVRAVLAEGYPDVLQRNDIGGTVRLLLRVDARGRVRSAEVARSSRIGFLDQVARNGLASARFEPARQGEVPVGTWIDLEVTFQPGGTLPTMRTTPDSGSAGSSRPPGQEPT